MAGIVDQGRRRAGGRVALLVGRFVRSSSAREVLDDHPAVACLLARVLVRHVRSPLLGGRQVATCVSPILDRVRGRTHALLGAAAALPISAHSGRAALIGLAAGVVGSLLPDVDHPGSTVGRWVPWPAVREGPYRVGRWWPGGVIWHRGELHSLGAAAIAATLAGMMATQVQGWLPPGAIWVVTVGVMLGYLSHLLADLMSPTPQMLLWPLSRRRWRPPWLPAVEVDSVPGHPLEAMVSAAALTFLVAAGRSLVPPVSEVILRR